MIVHDAIASQKVRTPHIPKQEFETTVNSLNNGHHFCGAFVTDHY